MTAGDTTQGRRLPDRDGLKGSLFEPGDYQKVTIDGDVTWFCRPPRGAIGALRDHTITENADGTITASPSILMPSDDPRQAWHGYLENGVWREV